MILKLLQRKKIFEAQTKIFKNMYEILDTNVKFSFNSMQYRLLSWFHYIHSLHVIYPPILIGTFYRTLFTFTMFSKHTNHNFSKVEVPIWARHSLKIVNSPHNSCTRNKLHELLFIYILLLNWFYFIYLFLFFR